MNVDDDDESLKKMPHTSAGERGATLSDVIELAEALRQERLYISHERSAFYHEWSTLKESCIKTTEVPPETPTIRLLLTFSLP